MSDYHGHLVENDIDKPFRGFVFPPCTYVYHPELGEGIIDRLNKANPDRPYISCFHTGKRNRIRRHVKAHGHNECAFSVDGQRWMRFNDRGELIYGRLEFLRLSKLWF